MLPIPNGIEVVDQFGEETIRTETNLYVRGVVTIVRGTQEHYWKWLGHLPGVWTSSSPMLGSWSIRHVRPPKLGFRHSQLSNERLSENS